MIPLIHIEEPDRNHELPNRVAVAVAVAVALLWTHTIPLRDKAFYSSLTASGYDLTNQLLRDARSTTYKQRISRKLSMSSMIILPHNSVAPKSEIGALKANHDG